APDTPPRPLEVGHRQQVLTHRLHPTRSRPDKAGQDGEERRLGGATRADQAARAFRELHGHLVEGHDAAEVNRQLDDVDHAWMPFFSAARVLWIRLTSRPKPKSERANRVQNW